MSMDLNGEVVLVTGASRGIGAAIADLLAAKGAKVIGTATTQSGADAISARMADAGGLGKVLDVTDGAAVEAIIEDIAKNIGPVSVLVNVLLAVTTMLPSEASVNELNAIAPGETTVAEPTR